MKKPHHGLKGADALGEIGARLGDLFGAVKDAFEAGGDDYERTERFGGEGGLSGVSSVRVRMGGLGGDAATSEAPKAAKAKERAAPAAREVPVELHEDGDALEATAEVPGCGTEDVSARVEGRALIIESRGDMPYTGRAELPDGNWRVAGHAVRHGVLSVELEAS